MLKILHDELIPLQERMHRKSKKKFREYLKEKASELNLSYNITPNTRFSKNVVIGNIKEAKYIIGAHYDTPPRMPSFLMRSVLFFNIIIIIFYLLLIFMPIHSFIKLIIYTILTFYFFGFMGMANKYNYNDNTSGVLSVLYLMNKLKDSNVAFIFFDNEEKGLIGSLQLMVYLKRIKQNLNRKRYIIFDCVGRGEVFRLFSYNKNSLPSKIKTTFDKLNFTNYSFEIKKGSTLEMSDHVAFKNYNHVGIMAYNKRGKKYHLTNIHSHKDKYINLDNIEVLTKTIEEYIMGENYES